MTYSDKYSTKLSGSGLIFKYFGDEVVVNTLE